MGVEQPIKAYKVVIYLEGERDGAGEEVIGKTSVDIYGLEEGTRYTFRLSALNAGGWGELSPATPEVKTRGRKPQSFGFVLTWIMVELILVAMILAIICFCWRKRKLKQEEADHNYMELGVTDDDLDAFREGTFSLEDNSHEEIVATGHGERLDFKGILTLTLTLTLTLIGGLTSKGSYQTLKNSSFSGTSVRLRVILHNSVCSGPLRTTDISGCSIVARERGIS